MSRISANMRKNGLVDLNIFYKAFIFSVIWIPLRRFYRRYDFREDGYYLKAHQVNYYMVLGIIFLIVNMICLSYTSPTQLILGIWVSEFLLCYLFDISYNRKRLIKNIQNVIDTGEIPFGF